MAKLFCAVILVAGWALVLATKIPQTDEERIAECQKITTGTKYTIEEDEYNPCAYICHHQDSDGVSKEENVVIPDGVICDIGMECFKGQCLNMIVKDTCQVNMPDVAIALDLFGDCFIMCANENGTIVQWVQAPSNYPCQTNCGSTRPAYCDANGRCITGDEITANAPNFPRANDARAFMDCATRYTNGAHQYGENNLELTSAYAGKYWEMCGYTCEFTNTVSQSVVQEGYCFAELTDCTDTTDPDAEEMVCVAGDCQSKAIYDTCVAKGYPPVELNTAFGCTSFMCNWRDIFYESLGTKCVDDDHKNGTCDGQGFCVTF